MTPQIEAFLEMMSVERGASENTLSSYRRDLEDASQVIEGGLAGAGSDDIRGYLGEIAARGFAASSQARKLSALRQFFKFLYAENLRPDDPTGTIESPKKGRPLPDPDDRRGVIVELTEEGKRLWDAAVGAQAEKESIVSSALGDREKRQLNELLRRLMHAFEDAHGPVVEPRE